MTTVYLAGPSNGLARVERYADKLERLGLVIAYPWWRHVTARRTRGLSDADLTIDEQAAAAEVNLAAIRSCRILWCLWPRIESHGTAFELGFALAYAARAFEPPAIVVTGDRVHQCHFTSLGGFRDASDDVGLVEVARLAALIRPATPVIRAEP